MINKFWEGILFGMGSLFGFLICIMLLQLSAWVLKSFGILLN